MDTKAKALSPKDADDLRSRLRESGEAATRVAGSLRAILQSPDLKAAAFDELVIGLSTRCMEINDLRLAVASSELDGMTKRVADQLHDLWHEMSKMAGEKARTSQE